ncbi:MAG: leucine-rich repeat protein [Clostridia bacterium]|nr:leucine-rich repeat protein [Clostridia bacterium]
MTESIQYSCPNCGGILESIGRHLLRCPYCGSDFERPSVEKKTESLQALFDREKIKYVNNQRRNLYDAVCAPHISKIEVERYATEIKKLLPDDFQANFYLDAISGNIGRINQIIRGIDVNENYDLLPPIISFLIASLEIEYLLELNLLVERAYQNRDPETYSRLMTKIEAEANKVKNGIYVTSMPRDVFIAYSSKDMDKVSALCEALEQEGFSCFVAARNLRHGVGSVENYDEALKVAMDYCSCFVFVSSANSRSFSCDAVRKEIPYIRSKDVLNAPAEFRNNYRMIPPQYKLPRIEYRIGTGRASDAASKVTDAFFEGYEWVYDINGVIERLLKLLYDIDPDPVTPVSYHEHSEQKQSKQIKQPERTKQTKQTDQIKLPALPDPNPNCKHVLVTDPGREPTCTENGYTEGEHCKRCGSILRQSVTIPAEGHRFGPWTRIKYPTCTNDGLEERACHCGEKETKTIPSLGGHKPGEWEIAKAAGHEQEGLQVKNCIECGLTVKEEKIPAQGHEFGDWKIVKKPSCTEQGKQQRACSCGKTETKGIPAKGHSFGAWQTVKAPTCTENGEQQRSCSACGKTETKTVPSYNGHVLGEWETVKKAGHETDGLKIKKCIRCGDTVEQEIIPAQGHSFGEWQTVKFASCSEKGERKRLCYCGEKETEAIPALGGHKPGEWEIIKEPNHENEGLKIKKCRVCGERTEEKIIPAQGHNFGEWQTVKYPTCTENGEQKRICSCGVTETKPVPSLGGHKPGVWTVIEEATEDREGWKVKICRNCGERLGEEKIFAQAQTTNRSTHIEQTNPASQGLAYTVNSNGKTCAVTGQGTCKDKDVVIPETIDGYQVTRIGTSAFLYCQSLASVVIPSSVTSIGERAFYGCTSLASVGIPDSVTSIDHSAFHSCTSLASVVIPSSVTSIGDHAFSSCQSLASVVIPSSVTSIGERAFYGCTLLASVNLPDSVETVGNGAFYGCEKLSDIRLPQSLKKIGDITFYNCKNLVHIDVPDSVTVIGYSAFSGCSALKSVIIPDTVVSIGNYAFRNCSGLTSVTVPNSVTVIKKQAFSSCTNLKEFRYIGTKAQWNQIRRAPDWQQDSGIDENQSIIFMENQANPAKATDPTNNVSVSAGE